MKLNFLGGVTEVGSLSMYMENMGNHLLFDYGFTPSSPPKLPIQAPSVDMAFLTHAHIDHAGLIPQLCARTGTPIVATAPTLEIAKILWRDSHKINRIEGYPQMFSVSDIGDAEKYFDIVSYNENRNINGLEVVFHSAGHVPGSMMVEIQGMERTVFTGDMNSVDSGLLKGAKPIDCDNLIIEATYGGRDHLPRDTQVKKFIEKVNEVVERGGQVIIPAFAVGRTQEIMVTLKGQAFDIWVDGMGKAVAQIFLNHSDYLRSSRDLREGIRNVNYVRTPSDRKRAQKAEVVITTSGMMEGGPVLGYVQNIKDDPKSAILMTGYQVENTNGRLLLDSGRLKLYGVEREIKCEVDFFDFSAHSGHSELVSFIRACDPTNVVLFHSEEREPIVKELGNEYNFILAEPGEMIEL